MLIAKTELEVLESKYYFLLHPGRSVSADILLFYSLFHQVLYCCCFSLLNVPLVL
jgi:hypothetical protein